MGDRWLNEMTAEERKRASSLTLHIDMRGTLLSTYRFLKR